MYNFMGDVINIERVFPEEAYIGVIPHKFDSKGSILLISTDKAVDRYIKENYLEQWIPEKLVTTRYQAEVRKAVKKIKDENSYTSVYYSVDTLEEEYWRPLRWMMDESQVENREKYLELYYKYDGNLNRIKGQENNPDWKWIKRVEYFSPLNW